MVYFKHKKMWLSKAECQSNKLSVHRKKRIERLKFERSQIRIRECEETNIWGG